MLLCRIDRQFYYYIPSSNLALHLTNRFKNNGQNFQVHVRPPAGHHHQGQQHSATAGSIGRKNRDVMQLLSKNASTNDQVNKTGEATSSKCTVLDLFIKSLQENHGSQVLCKKVFKLGEKEILVSSEKSSSKETYICTMILYVIQASFHGRTKQILPFCRRH
jgi:hypothetical protein